MKKKRFSTEQIAAVLHQAEQGVPVGELCRQVGISEQSFYRWKKAYGGLLPSEARELKQLRDEVSKLKRLVADLSLDKVMLQDIVQKKGPEACRAARSDALRDGPLRGEHATGVPRAADDSIVGVLPRPEGSSDRAPAADARTRADAGALRLSPAPGALAAGGLDGRQGAFYRVYTEEGLALRRKRPWRHVMAVHREQRRPAAARNDSWSMDFVADECADGRRFRALTVLDLFTRECLAIDAGRAMSGQNVAAIRERLRFERGLPQRIHCDNGTEFVSAASVLTATDVVRRLARLQGGAKFFVFVSSAETAATWEEAAAADPGGELPREVAELASVARRGNVTMRIGDAGDRASANVLRP